ncbi:hypothetical protein BaRGS_00006656 [Batillaria attramentaria]|uniref:Uncharacterized protein n=1 Tax=Batillaria attramentaria TaxID=370345 RepID=A0ABD0LQE2_9CAEN
MLVTKCFDWSGTRRSPSLLSGSVSVSQCSLLVLIPDRDLCPGFRVTDLPAAMVLCTDVIDLSLNKVWFPGNFTSHTLIPLSPPPPSCGYPPPTPPSTTQQHLGHFAVGTLQVEALLLVPSVSLLVVHVVAVSGVDVGVVEEPAATAATG